MEKRQLHRSSMLTTQAGVLFGVGGVVSFGTKTICLGQCHTHPGNKALLGEYSGMMVVNHPLIRQGGIGGGILRFT